MAIDLDLETRIEGARRADRPRLRQRLRSIRRAQRAGKPFDRNLTQFAAALQQSIELRELRRRSLPPITFPADLPICARREEIAAAIAAHQVVVVCGETGSGKSTQLPKICLALGRGVDGLIGHTQPRRIAARSVAARIAAELSTPLGQAVGYKVRFSDAAGERTYVKLMTDGILLAESQQDRYLNQYDTLIIDEAHERSLNIDFLLGYLRRILPQRPDLKVIITSATIDAERFSHFFAAVGSAAAINVAAVNVAAVRATTENVAEINTAPTTLDDSSLQNVPVIEVSGRAYPVEIRHRPVVDAGADASDPAMLQAVLDAVDELAAIDSGDMLIFMPTEQHIHAAAKALRGRLLPNDRSPSDLPTKQTEIVPLYARLATGEQQRIFEPHAQRRIVIATNVAESSLTVAGIRFVIDTGTARISRYASRSKSQRLPIEPISQASADQRAGRCGRVGPGVCIRLYSAEDYAQRPRFTAPEIQRSNLAGVILQAKALGLGALEDFPLLDRPRPDAVRDGYATLFELGAIDQQQQLTDIGRALARLPVDPRIGRLILAGDRENCLHEILVIAAALATQDPRLRPHDRREAADLAHSQFIDERSDFLSYWNLWTYLRDLKARLSRSQFRKACEDAFLSPARVREWQEARRQLARITAQAGMREGAPRRDSFDAIHRSLLTAFLSNVARRSQHRSRRGQRGADREQATKYDLTGGRAAVVWPRAGFVARPRDGIDGVGEHLPKWIVASEVVETNRRYVRTIGQVQRGWIEELAPHLIERSYYDPHWDANHGAAIVYEDVSLFGLIVAHQRRVPLASIDPEQAREMFLWSGLARGDFATRAKFFAHNQELLRNCEQLEQRSRRKGLVRGEEARYAFYAARLPREVVDGRTFEAWRRRVEHADPRRLFMREGDLLRPGGESLDPRDFPDAMFVRNLRLPLEYAFEPGAERDGVTASVPRESFRHLDPHRLDWLVPGLVAEKVAALLKTLPKALRRQLFPLADTARRIAGQIGYGDGSLVWSVARAAGKLAGESIPPGAFRPERLPDHLKMRIRVVDDAGRALAVGRDMSQLRRKLWVEADDYVSQRVGEVYLDGMLWNRAGITTWDFGELPDEIQLPESDITLIGYPAVVDQGDSVALELMPCPQLAARESRAGIRRLAVLAYQPALVAQVEWLPGLSEIARDASAWMDERALRAELVDLLADWAFFPDGNTPTETSAPHKAERHAEHSAAPGWEFASVAERASGAERLPRDAGEFAACLAAGRQRLGIGAQELTDFVGPLFNMCQHVRQRLTQATDSRWKYAVCDMRSQIDVLLRPGFLTATPRRHLTKIPRYLAAVASRLDRLAAGMLERDEAHFAEVHPRWQNVLALLADEQADASFDPQLEAFRWLLEEYRVAAFAPSDGPAGENTIAAQQGTLPVCFEPPSSAGATALSPSAADFMSMSLARLDAQWNRVRLG